VFLTGVALMAAAAVVDDSCDKPHAKTMLASTSLSPDMLQSLHLPQAVIS
jgi:hypothetical protein